MTFEEALTSIWWGNWARRQSWEPNRIIATTNPREIGGERRGEIREAFVDPSTKQAEGPSVLYEASDSDIAATDWEVVE